MAINVNIVLVTILHWHSVVKLLQFRMQMFDFVKVGAAMLISGLASYGIMYTDWVSSQIVRFIAACTVGMLLYLLCAVLLRLINRSDVLRVITLGHKLVK